LITQTNKQTNKQPNKKQQNNMTLALLLKWQGENTLLQPQVYKPWKEVSQKRGKVFDCNAKVLARSGNFLLVSFEN